MSKHINQDAINVKNKRKSRLLFCLTTVMLQKFLISHHLASRVLNLCKFDTVKSYSLSLCSHAVKASWEVGGSNSLVFHGERCGKLTTAVQ